MTLLSRNDITNPASQYHCTVLPSVLLAPGLPCVLFSPRLLCVLFAHGLPCVLLAPGLPCVLVAPGLPFVLFAPDFVIPGFHSQNTCMVMRFTRNNDQILLKKSHPCRHRKGRKHRTMQIQNRRQDRHHRKAFVHLLARSELT